MGSGEQDWVGIFVVVVGGVLSDLCYILERTVCHSDSSFPAPRWDYSCVYSLGKSWENLMWLWPYSALHLFSGLESLKATAWLRLGLTESSLCANVLLWNVPSLGSVTLGSTEWQTLFSSPPEPPRLYIYTHKHTDTVYTIILSLSLFVHIYYICLTRICIPCKLNLYTIWKKAKSF